jgi:hypothetical protein
MSQPNQPALVVVSRHRVDDRTEFARQARQAIAVLATCDGFEHGAIGQATDETSLITITTRWTGVGAYRRALSKFEVKTEVIPLLSTAVDESTAFEVVHERFADRVVDAASGRAADADVANLGSSSAGYVPPVIT